MPLGGDEFDDDGGVRRLRLLPGGGVCGVVSVASDLGEHVAGDHPELVGARILEERTFGLVGGEHGDVAMAEVGDDHLLVDRVGGEDAERGDDDAIDGVVVDQGEEGPQPVAAELSARSTQVLAHGPPTGGRLRWPTAVFARIERTRPRPPGRRTRVGIPPRAPQAPIDLLPSESRITRKQGQRWVGKGDRETENRNRGQAAQQP